MSSEIVVIGSLAYDTISTPSGKKDRTLGGSANYFSVASSLFTKVNAVGVVGEDYGDNDINVLKNRGVDVSGVQIVPGKTFHWEGKYEGDLNEAVTLATELNVFADFKPQLSKEYSKSEFVFLANIDPEIQLEVLEQVDKPKFIACDTMNFWIETKKSDVLKVLSKVDAILINETEAMMLTKAPNAVSAAKEISKLGPKIIVIKRGEYGFMLFQEGNFFILPAFPLETIVDPTGAGDTFAGGFMGYLSKMNHPFKEEDVRSACMYGTVLASFTVEDFSLGRIKNLPLDQVETRLKEYKKVVTVPKA